MKSLIQTLNDYAFDALKKSFSNLESEALKPELAKNANPSFGDYQCNNALPLAKILKEPPRKVAEKIVSHFSRMLPDGSSFIDKIEIAGPGFINITLSDEYIAKKIEALVEDSRLGVPPIAHTEKVIVEFSSPNVAKELHVGHLRSTIIGDSLARLFEFLGYEVLRLNHIGDWGTQFGMLIAYMQEFHPEVLNGSKKTDLQTLMGWYRASKKVFDEDPQFKKSAQLQVVKLQGGDPHSLAAWKIICAISREAYQEIYDLLDVKLQERGESFYNSYLPEIVMELEKRGLLQISDGAKCVFLDGFETREGEPLPLIVQKSDGGYNYATTDLAGIRHRVDIEKAKRIICVVDAGQSLHFQMVFKTAALAGFYDPSKVLIEHVGFGVVLGPDGKKFKTRSGETERLIDLLNQAVQHATVILAERMPELSQEQLKEMAEVLGIDAVKYADLSSHRVKDYVFSYERMLKFEGNTAAFLLYAYVRIQSIKRKVGKSVETILSSQIILEHPSERALGLHLIQFAETIEAVSRDLLPHRLCEYLYELAEKFHAFFRDCRVEGDPKENSRLFLCEAAARVLRQGLNLLGLKTLDRM